MPLACQSCTNAPLPCSRTIGLPLPRSRKCRRTPSTSMKCPGGGCARSDRRATARLARAAAPIAAAVTSRAPPATRPERQERRGVRGIARRPLGSDENALALGDVPEQRRRTLEQAAEVRAPRRRLHVLAERHERHRLERL